MKELSVPLRNKSERKYQSDPWNLIVITGTIVVASLTTQAAALITFGKWGSRNNQPSQAGSGPGYHRSATAEELEEPFKDIETLQEKDLIEINRILIYDNSGTLKTVIEKTPILEKAYSSPGNMMLGLRGTRILTPHRGI